VLQGGVFARSLRLLTNSLKSFKLRRQKFYSLCNLKVAHLQVLKAECKTKFERGDCHGCHSIFKKITILNYWLTQLEGLVLSDSVSSLWLVSFGLFACLDFVLCLLFLFLSPFLGCFLFIKFGRVSSIVTSFAMKKILIWFFRETLHSYFFQLGSGHGYLKIKNHQLWGGLGVNFQKMSCSKTQRAYLNIFHLISD
jgi:cellulose synthase/poly-beta-1,6-N-acetylglucosamine synthase-like glycosyltransferase